MSSQMEQLYQQVILDHAKFPHGKGLGVAGDLHLHTGESHQVNPTARRRRLALHARPKGAAMEEIETRTWVKFVAIMIGIDISVLSRTTLRARVRLLR